MHIIQVHSVVLVTCIHHILIGCLLLLLTAVRLTKQ
jgi:hypothetical protein